MHHAITRNMIMACKGHPPQPLCWCTLYVIDTKLVCATKHKEMTNAVGDKRGHGVSPHNTCVWAAQHHMFGM